MTFKEPFDCKELILQEDTRGFLFEILRFKDWNIPANGQIYTFSVKQNVRRGDHYHLEKREWFTCVSGKVTILLSNELKGSETSFDLDATRPQIIYCGPKTNHTLINVDEKEAVIIAYASVQHDDKISDTYKSGYAI